MLSNYQLANWHFHMANTPEGAYDGAGGAASHGFGRRPIPGREFARGGAFDAIGQMGKGDVNQALKFLATKLSREDWMELREVLCGGEAEAEDEPDLKAKILADDPPPFRGQPETGGHIRGMDSRSRVREASPDDLAAFKAAHGLSAKRPRILG